MMSSGQGKFLMTKTIALVNFTIDQQICLNVYDVLDIVEKSSLMVNRKPIILRNK